MSSAERFDVVIYEKATGEVESIAGRNLPRWDGKGSGRNTVELREQTVRERINARYDVLAVRAGTTVVGDRLGQWVFNGIGRKRFDTREAALDWARRNGYAEEVKAGFLEPAQVPARKPEAKVLEGEVE